MRFVKQKLVIVVLYGAAAIAMANWIEYALWPGQPYGGATLLKIALVGAVLFVGGAVVSFFSHRFAILFGAAALCFSWPYFSLLAANLPWNHGLFWLIKIHYHGDDQVMALAGLTAATVYLLVQIPAAVSLLRARKKMPAL
jgi:hypothetical protein